MLERDNSTRADAEATDITARTAVSHAANFGSRDEKRLQSALNQLEKTDPEFSARITTRAWQRRALAAGGLTVALAIVLAPAPALTTLFAVLSIPFLCVAGLRLMAIWHLATARSPNEGEATFEPPATPDAQLPTYTVLVPVFDEAHVVPGLLQALREIDYPEPKIEFLFLTERIDKVTRAALFDAGLDENMHVLTVPHGAPRTKPRAMNYALQSARGDIVTVYDAEDIPEPDQLRRATALLRQTGFQTGCIQAQLNVYNADDCWLTRQFTIEYTALFDALLPALHRLSIPIPLGGTSNHFPRRALDKVGAWDSYNVTEDADLGIRLARHGLKVHLLDSTTWEEAPSSFDGWLGQRTRWMKGFMQTYLVHMREPIRVVRELGVVSFIGLQVLMVGLILSPLIHPWFIVALVSDIASRTIGGTDASILAQSGWLYWVGIINLVLGYGAAIALGALSVAKRGWYKLIVHALTMPVYWLLISLGAYKALFELTTAPHHWQKTDHATKRDWQIPSRQE